MALYEVGPGAIRNLVFVASDEPLPPLPGRHRSSLPESWPDDVITDRLNPLDRLQIVQGEAFRDWYLKVLGAEALLP